MGVLGCGAVSCGQELISSKLAFDLDHSTVPFDWVAGHRTQADFPRVGNDN